jgi:hypothetical protein
MSFQTLATLASTVLLTVFHGLKFFFWVLSAGFGR